MRRQETIPLAIFRFFKRIIVGGAIIILSFIGLYRLGYIDVNVLTLIQSKDHRSVAKELSQNTLDAIGVATKKSSDIVESGKSLTKPQNNSAAQENQQIQVVASNYVPLKFSKSLQLKLGDFDQLGRATSAHIRLKNSDRPQKQREPRLNYNPVGWHNYRFTYRDPKNGNIKKAWLMNRGHLVGYQFSGLNAEGRNLVPMTRFLNAGSISDRGFGNDSNPYGMLFYENQLGDWLRKNPSDYLDYYVVANYTGNELIPRSVKLSWTAFDNGGKQTRVDLKDSGRVTIDNMISSVTLENTSENAEIDYLTGTATQR